MASITKRRVRPTRRLSRLPDIPLPPSECPVSRIFELIGHRWSVQVLWLLNHVDRPLRFRELQRSLEPVTQKELTNRLRELEAASMVHRTVFAEVPPRVEYQITEVGRSIMPLLFALADWVRNHGLDMGVREGKASKKVSRSTSSIPR